MFHAADGGDAAPGLLFFADGDAVADWLAPRRDVVEKLVVGIDDDGARGFLAAVVDDVAAELFGNCGLFVRQIGH